MKRYLIIASTIWLLLPALAHAKGAPDPKEVPQRIVELLAQGDLKKAIFEMREMPPCPKINHLMHSANRIVLSEMEKKPSRSAAHETYQNRAIAYHNLFLFLKARGISQDDFLEGALGYYKKARRSGTYLHRAECDVLLAALTASGGNIEEARKKFEKIDDLMLRGDFESMEYLAAYHAAVGDARMAIEAVEAAFRLDPKKTVEWLDVSDDFHGLEADPEFIAFKTGLNERRNKREIMLSVPECDQPRLQMAGTDPNAPLGFSRKAKRQMNARNKKKAR